MELFLLAVIIHGLSLFEGFEGAAISSSENVSMPYTTDEYLNKNGGPYSLSLSYSCSGALQTYYNGKWVAVTLKSESTQKKEIIGNICKDLGCGGIIDYWENNSTHFNTCLSDCTIINSTLHNCVVAASTCSKVTEVNCERHAVRLSGWGDKCAGRVELLNAGLWGSVCDDEWDLKGGQVVCAQLGCGTAVMITREARYFGPGIGPIHLSKMNCTGTEKNLWQCSTDMSEDNYCGHKEDAGVVCSECIGLPVTTVNTINPDITNWTTEYVTEMAVGESSTWLSAPVVGCIVLSITLLLVLFSIAAHCVYYKRKNVYRRNVQEETSETSSDSDYEHYTSQPTTANNPDYTSVIGESSNAQVSISRERNAQQYPPIDDHDSDSTSSEESYKNTQSERDKLFNPDDDHDSNSTSSGGWCEKTQTEKENLFNPEHSDELQMLPLHNFNHLAKNNHYDHDSDSTSSRECYENTQTEGEQFYNPAVDQFSPTHSVELQMPPLSKACQPDWDPAESDSTSSGECYENTGMYAEADIQTLEGNPQHPVQSPVSQTTSQIGGNDSLPQPCSPDQDDSSTSSEEMYENVLQLDKVNYLTACEPEQTSSDSDYDDVADC